MKDADALKFMSLGYRGDISALDEEGRSLLWRAGDLRARWKMNHMAEREYDKGNYEGCCTLIHAERYLSELASCVADYAERLLEQKMADSAPPVSRT